MAHKNPHAPRSCWRRGPARAVAAAFGRRPW